jgi:hypothetical protein
MQSSIAFFSVLLDRLKIFHTVPKHVFPAVKLNIFSIITVKCNGNIGT